MLSRNVVLIPPAVGTQRTVQDRDGARAMAVLRAGPPHGPVGHTGPELRSRMHGLSHSVRLRPSLACHSLSDPKPPALRIHVVQLKFCGERRNPR